MTINMSFKAGLAAIFLATTSGAALADEKTEAYVQENATNVLNSLNEPDITVEERREKFQAYMEEFSNLDAVAKFVVGRYATQFNEDDLDRYITAFRTYALAVYEFYFNEYRGQGVEVTGSLDRNARDSIVDTTILRGDGQELTVRWRVLQRGGKYQVVDIALNADGNLIWLAIEQRAQFLSILDQNNGSPDALIAKIDSMTQELVDEREAAASDEASL
ncbi:MAG: ABC transporter substrate-binding protein [Pseudomonadota bacterium]